MGYSTEMIVTHGCYWLVMVVYPTDVSFVDPVRSESHPNRRRAGNERAWFFCPKSWGCWTSACQTFVGENLPNSVNNIPLLSIIEPTFRWILLDNNCWVWMIWTPNPEVTNVTSRTTYEWNTIALGKFSNDVTSRPNDGMIMCRESSANHLLSCSWIVIICAGCRYCF